MTAETEKLAELTTRNRGLKSERDALKTALESSKKLVGLRDAEVNRLKAEVVDTVELVRSMSEDPETGPDADGAEEISGPAEAAEIRCDRAERFVERILSGEAYSILEMSPEKTADTAVAVADALAEALGENKKPAEVEVLVPAEPEGEVV